MAQYGKAEYWTERYTRDPEQFDWYQRYAGIKDCIKDHLSPDHQILNIGCGNSRLSEELHDDGFKNITNVDTAEVVINRMKEQYDKTKGEMAWRVMDIRKMSDLQDGWFNCVLDKGTLDSILCGESSTSNAQKALSEVSRVLNKNGVYICISHGQPTYRLTYLQRPEFGWNVTIQSVQKPMMGMTVAAGGEEKDNVHHIYICKKGVEDPPQ